MENRNYVLSIDLGTSGPKIVLLSDNLEMVDSAFVSNTVNLLDGGGAEQDPNEWWESIVTGIQKIIETSNISTEQIKAISCTGQWSGTVAMNKEGQHLMPAIIWLDSRGAAPLEHVTNGFPKVEGYGLKKLMDWIKITGGAPGHAGKDPMAHILYIKNKFPEIYKQTYKFLEPKDYINFKLTGQFVSTFDTMTLHWLTDNRDINNIKYHEGLIKVSSIDQDKLPNMINSTDIIGKITSEIADELGLDSDTLVVGGTPDVQSAAIGAGTVRDYEANLCIGTSTFLTCHVPFKKTDLLHNCASLPSGIPGKYLLMNEQESSGACLNFLKDNILFADDHLKIQPGEGVDIFEAFDEMAESIQAGSEGLIFTPWLYGERSPIEDKYIRGGFNNLGLNHNRSHMVRAVMEGVALNTKWLFIYYEKFIKQKCKTINMIGGGAMSKVWCQIIADVLGCKINQVKEPRHANARGAAALALVGLKLRTFEEFADQTVIDNVFEPRQENRKIYDQLFDEFRNIYKKNKNIHARLNK